MGRKHWIAGYPFNTLVEKLIDNYGQARGCMSRMETRLLKKGRIAEFNRQFQDNVNRGVFKPIPREEADRYKGAVITSAWWRYPRPARLPPLRSGSA